MLGDLGRELYTLLFETAYPLIQAALGLEGNDGAALALGP